MCTFAQLLQVKEIKIEKTPPLFVTNPKKI